MAELLSFSVALHMRLAYVPEGGRATRPSPSGALRAALTARPFSLGSWPTVMSSATENERSSNMSEIDQFTVLVLDIKTDDVLGPVPRHHLSSFLHQLAERALACLEHSFDLDEPEALGAFDNIRQDFRVIDHPFAVLI